MRANLLQAEPKHQERWDRIRLYDRLQERPVQKKYVFHDGPPYANGAIHMGHLLNKILKDLVVRSRQMDGNAVHYVPGWDCHGLPIEHRVLKELGPKGRELETVEIRKRCHDYASRYVKLQAEQMQRLGTIADYKHPYVTMDPAYEGAVLEVFAELVEQGIVYRDVKPVHWSIANQTALAEAELEYYDRTDTSVYVLFAVNDAEKLPSALGLPAGKSASLMIWTTTPWTLPANLAVAVGPFAEYGLFRVLDGDTERFIVVAEALAPRVLGREPGTSFDHLGTVTGRELADAGITYRHPFLERDGKVVTADYVTLEDGTGLVHTAPGHGAEDYYTGLQNGLPVYCPVLGDGTFDESVAEWLQGVDVWSANKLIVEWLRDSGDLYFDHQYEHSYPHDWRSKTPTIFRATEQWFIAVDKPFGTEAHSLRQRALGAARNSIRFVPDWGQSRLEGMLESRPDWCISRQRAWGLPIPAFLNEKGEALLTNQTVKAVAQVVRRMGSDYWFRAEPADLLDNYDPAADPEAPEWARSKGTAVFAELQKSQDIFDVWFESGSSWNGVLRERKIGYPADLYLEGSDQHRGWFQLSLLPGLGATGVSPFKTVLTHGFMVDAEGRKMSKSGGNALEVGDVLKTHGADICRWWVSSLNYTTDIKVDWEFFKVAGEEYRKVRNTLRFLLGNLNDFDPDAPVPEWNEADRFSIDSWVLERLSSFIRDTRLNYEHFQFKRVSEAIFNFCNDELSSVYLAAIKDRLYCDRPDSRRRKRSQAVMYRLADALIRTIAPILVHTAEEAWLALRGEDMDSETSVHLEELPAEFDHPADDRWNTVMEFRGQVLKSLETAKAGDPELKNPLDAGIRAVVSARMLKALEPFRAELSDLCGVSRLNLEEGAETAIEVVNLKDQPRCERSWRRDETVKLRSDGGWLSDRDAEVLGLAQQVRPV
jgi:isoleucyl-tRNA synthetase